MKTYTFFGAGESSKTGSGTTAAKADIENKDINGDGILEVIQTGVIINCGDSCLCWEGPVEDEFQNIFTWNEMTETFVEHSAE